MTPNHTPRALRELFSALVEHAFYVEVGLCDPRLTDYLVGLLCDFVHVDRLHKIHDARGKRLETIAEMLAQLSRDDGDGPVSRLDIQRHIGDFALFWAGVYPEGLRGRRYQPNPDQLLSYVHRGKEAYAVVSRMCDEDAEPPRSLFRRLSAEFEVCAHGLGLVRRGWEQREGGGAGPGGWLVY